MVEVTVVCVLRWQGWQKFFLLLCNCFLKLCLIRVNKVWTYLVACVMYMLTAYGLLNVSHSFSFFFFCLLFFCCFCCRLLCRLSVLNYCKLCHSLVMVLCRSYILIHMRCKLCCRRPLQTAHFSLSGQPL